MRTKIDSSLSDLELVDAVLAKTSGAFEVFYRRYEQLIYSCIRKRAVPHDVDDIFQRFFEKLVAGDYRILTLWQRGTSLPLYLAKVVRNLVIDAHRAKNKREEGVGGVAELDILSPAQDETSTASTVLREFRRLALQGWSALEGRDRRLLCDRLHRDLETDEIAGRLRLSPGAVRTALSRAQARLIQELRVLAPEFFPESV